MTTNEVVQVNTDTEDSSSPIDNQFTAILSTLCQFKTQITAISTQMKTLEKTVKREIKQHKKEVIKKQAKGNRKPSGFAAASPISEELCDFMGKERGTSIARTEVTKFICSYILNQFPFSICNATNIWLIRRRIKSIYSPSFRKC